MSAHRATDSPVRFHPIAHCAENCDQGIAAHYRQVKSPTGTGAESPTTVRPLDMDDDDVQETGALSGDTPALALIPKRDAVEEVAPAKPPRPLTAQQQAENTLKEAFPSIDAAVVKAVLTASGGRVEPAFNALLGMVLSISSSIIADNS